MSSPAVVWEHRNLIANLARRDLKAKYKKSLLGWMWSLINPAAPLAVYTFVFGIILKGRAPQAGNGSLKAFSLYLFAGLVVWNLFSNTLSASMEALEDSGELLTKIYFPPECPAFAAVLGVVLQGAMETVILVVALAVAGNLSWTMLLIPVVLVAVILLATGIGLVLSVANIHYRDVGYITTIAMQVLFYCTPIVYPLELIPERVWGLPAQRLIGLNPVARCVSVMRDLVWHLRLPSAADGAYVLIVAGVVFALSWWWFSSRSPRVIEEL